jgi:hypothetical protein
MILPHIAIPLHTAIPPQVIQTTTTVVAVRAVGEHRAVGDFFIKKYRL